MRHFMLGAAALAAGMIAGPALAQTQAPAQQPAAAAVPEKMPFDIPYGQSIGAEKAKQVLAAAEAEGKKRDWKMNIAVVDTNGELVAFLRTEGAQIASVNISQGKARTAARFRRPTRAFFNGMQATAGAYLPTLDPTLIASPGGIPLVEGGKLIGAIGCSGGTGDQDEIICKAGADLIK